jgi:hypothetical protein
MKTSAGAIKSLSLALGTAVVLTACGGGTTSSTPDAASFDASVGSDAPPQDARIPDATPPDAAVATLTLSLDSTLDGDTDSVKATSIAAADLLDKSGSAVAHATITAVQAVFQLSGVAAGEFFIEVNGDADDLVPTKIDSPTTSVSQRVGEKLRASMIGPADRPIYRINTYSAGQAESPVAQFSDGTAIAGEQPYVFITLELPTMEFKILGTAATLTSTLPKSALHPGNFVPFDAWILNTSGQPHHGDTFNDDPSACATCHTSMDTKPASHAAITWMNGWCYRCHSGTGGDESGFVDPTK